MIIDFAKKSLIIDTASKFYLLPSNSQRLKALSLYSSGLLSMACAFVTVPKAFTLNKPSVPSASAQRLFRSPRNSLRINAVTQKWEPTRVVPQADRVLIRLEQLPEILSVGSEVGHVEPGNKVIFSDINAYEVDLGTDTKHCFYKESDLLATVE